MFQPGHDEWRMVNFPHENYISHCSLSNTLISFIFSMSWVINDFQCPNQILWLNVKVVLHNLVLLFLSGSISLASIIDFDNRFAAYKQHRNSFQCHSERWNWRHMNWASGAPYRHRLSHYLHDVFCDSLHYKLIQPKRSQQLGKFSVINETITVNVPTQNYEIEKKQAATTKH